MKDIVENQERNLDMEEGFTSINGKKYKSVEAMNKADFRYKKKVLLKTLVRLELEDPWLSDTETLMNFIESTNEFPELFPKQKAKIIKFKK